MAAPVNNLNLYSKENLTLLNPRWPATDFFALEELAKWAEQNQNLQGHLWMATSGSTADSIASTKLVALSKESLLNSASAVNEHLQATKFDIWTQVLPTYHVGGLGIEIRATLAGARIVSALKDQRWDALYFYKILCEEKCTLSALVPTQVYDLVNLNLKAPSHLRAVVVGGGALDSGLYMRARALNWPLLPSYGMTETGSQIATATLQSLCEPLFPEMVLLSHAEARTSSDGFIEIFATSLFTCYAQNRGLDKVCWDPKKQGWFKTEDSGFVKGGKIKIEGRGQEYIKIGAEGTNLARLRSILQLCVNLVSSGMESRVALIDMPSNRLGTEIHLVSALSDQLTEQIVQEYSQKVLPFEKVRKIYYVSQIPRNELGKIMWAELRRLL